MDKAELMADVRSARQELLVALTRFNEGERMKPRFPNQWTIKDLLAHIGFWEKRAGDILSALLREQEPEGAIDGESLDEVNQRAYLEYRDLPLLEIEQKEREAYLRLMDLVDNAPDDAIFRSDYFAWTDGRPFVDWIIGNTTDHYREHLQWFFS
jgi:hypothetical protein